MATSRPSAEIMEQLSSLLGGVARMIANGSQLGDRELRLLLIGADLDSEPEALNELRRWDRLLRELHEEPTTEARQATVEAFRLRGLLDAPIFLAVDEVTRSPTSPKSANLSSAPALKVTPANFEWHDLAPDQPITAELIVEGGPGHIVAESDQVRVTPTRLQNDITRLAVDIHPLSGVLLWTTIRLVTATGSLSVPVVATWRTGATEAPDTRPIQAASNQASLDAVRQLITTSVGPIWAMGVSPDGRYLVVQCDDGGDGLLRYWDIVHQRELYRLKLFMRHRDWGMMNYWEVMSTSANPTTAPDAIPLFERVPLPIVFSPDGRLLAWRDRHNIVYLWEIGVEEQAWQLRRLEWGPHCVAFSPDSQILATAGMSTPKLEVWDTRSRQVVWEVVSDLDNINKIVFSPDARRLATSGSSYFDGQDATVIRIWDVETGLEIWRQRLPASLGLLENLVFSDDGQNITLQGAAVNREQSTLDLTEACLISDPVTALAWHGNRHRHPWEWAKPGTPLPERDIQTRMDLDQAAERRAKLHKP